MPVKEPKVKTVKLPKVKTVKVTKELKVKDTNKPNKLNKLNKPNKNNLKDINISNKNDINTKINIIKLPEKKVKFNINSNSNTEYSNLNFNNLLNKAVSSSNFKLIKDSNNNKKAYNNYDASFTDISSFRNKFTKRDIDNIDVIIYHDENNDGMFSAAIAYHYLKENSSKDIILIAEKPGKFNFRDKIRDKNILILDLSLREDFIKDIINLSNSFIIIDDHSKTVLNNQYIFNGSMHSACGYTWKFFYPKIKIPNTILYIDSSDGKLFLSFIPKSYSTLFAQSSGIRYTHGKSKDIMQRKQTGDFFIELWNVLNNDAKLNMLIAIGHYYHEFSENLKEQIAINAVPMNFQGYKVGILNFNSPLLSKPVGRQIITNFKNRGIHIDFAILWGYEYTSNAYRVQLIDDHKQTRIRMDEISQKLGSIGGSPKGGGGHPHMGNFYWAKNNNRDIWDLFTKNYL